MSESTITDQRQKEIQLTLEGLSDELTAVEPAPGGACFEHARAVSAVSSSLKRIFHGSHDR